MKTIADLFGGLGLLAYVFAAACIAFKQPQAMPLMALAATLLVLERAISDWEDE